jgi:hypothetical protein
MTHAVWSTTAAAPLLCLGLRKIALTPRARLAVGYKLVPPIDTYVRSCEAPRVEIEGLRPLGNALYLDRLLAGGIVGEALPLANLRIYAQQANPLGGCLDVCG